MHIGIDDSSVHFLGWAFWGTCKTVTLDFLAEIKLRATRVTTCCIKKSTGRLQNASDSQQLVVSIALYKAIYQVFSRILAQRAVDAK